MNSTVILWTIYFEASTVTQATPGKINNRYLEDEEIKKFDKIQG